jgi:hypothetical protein
MGVGVLLGIVTALLVSPNPGAEATTARALSVEVSPAKVPAGSWATLTFTVVARTIGVVDGTVSVSVPPGWARPSTAPNGAGRVVASAGTVTVSGRSITIVGADIPRGSTLVVQYGGGPAGVTTTTQRGRATFPVSVTGANQPEADLSRTTRVDVRAPSSRCRTDREPDGAPSQLALPNGIARTNLYNVESANGMLRQCYSPTDGLTTTIALDGITPVGHGPAGYPEAAYGYDPFGHPFCRGCHSEPFPLRVADFTSDFHDYTVLARYELGAPVPATLPVDFMYNVWLEQNPMPGVAPQPGDVELLIFLYDQNIASCDASPIPVASLSSAAVFDDRPVLARWRVCQIRGGTAATPIAFFLEHPAPSTAAQVTLRISDFVRQAADYLWADLSAHLVMGIELGGEFAQCTPTGCTDGPLEWGYRIEHLSLANAHATIPIVFTP